MKTPKDIKMVYHKDTGFPIPNILPKAIVDGETERLYDYIEWLEDKIINLQNNKENGKKTSSI